ncbi:MAG: hypothetical protein IKE43_05630 [Coriobacteriales bacterium]|nr:hypothetical protein [Coriobacteriales bacterium]
MEELMTFFKNRIADAQKSACDLRADGREDEAALEQIRGNIYGIFVSVIETGTTHTGSPEELKSFFEKNLERIPSGWVIARDKARERGDTVRVVQEEVKLNAIQEIRDAYRQFCGDAS